MLALLIGVILFVFWVVGAVFMIWLIFITCRGILKLINRVFSKKDADGNRVTAIERMDQGLDRSIERMDNGTSAMDKALGKLDKASAKLEAKNEVAEYEYQQKKKAKQAKKQAKAEKNK